MVLARHPQPIGRVLTRLILALRLVVI
jgi:hypothetical protein